MFSRIGARGGIGTVFAIADDCMQEPKRRLSRQKIGEGLLTAGSTILLIVMLVVIDWRTTQKVTSLVQDRPFKALGSGVAWLEGAGSAFLDAIRYQSLEHAPMTVFFVVAVILVLFMTRT
jgi:hypothetical protein